MSGSRAIDRNECGRIPNAIICEWKRDYPAWTPEFYELPAATRLERIAERCGLSPYYSWYKDHRECSRAKRVISRRSGV